MKSKIKTKIIAIAIAVSALLAGVSVVKYYQGSSGENPIVVQGKTAFSARESSTQSSINIQASTSQTVDKPPDIPIGNIFWLVLKLTLLIAGIIFGFALLLKGLIKVFEWLGEDSRSKTSLNLGLLILLGLLFAVYFLPRSQALIFNSWKTKTGVKESGFFFDKIFGASPNRYDIDFQGRITALYLSDGDLHNLEQIPEFENLTSLQYLEISDSPLEGVIDVSPFVELKELNLRNTRLEQVVGLEHLTKLDRLNLEGSPIEKIESVGTAQKINLSRTKVTDLSFLSRLSSIQGLNLEEINFSQIKGFENLPPVETLSLRKSSRIPLETVGRIYSLKMLFLDGSDVSDLSPLRNLGELAVLSIFETKIESLDGLKNNSKLIAVNTDNPEFTPEKLKRLFNRDVVVSRINIDIFSFSYFFPAHIRQGGKLAAQILLGVGFLLLLPLPFAWRTPGLVRLKRIALFMIPGAFLVLILRMLANFSLPVSAGEEGLANFANVVTIYAAIVGTLWLVLMPLLMLLLDTKTLRQSVLSAPATMASVIFSWARPFVFVSPLFVFLGYSFWHSENTGNAGALFSIFLLMLCLFLPLGFGVVCFTMIWTGRNGVRRQLRYTLAFPAIGAVLSLALAVSIIVYLAVRGLGNVPLQSVVVMWFGFLALMAFNLGLQLIDAGINWRNKRREIANVLSGENAAEAVIEVPFRQNYFEFPVFSMANIVWKSLFSSPVEKDINVINANDVGQATSARVTRSAQKNLDGLIVIIQRRDLLRSKEWEFAGIGDWLREIYGKTWSPIWIVGDWIGEFMPENTSVSRKLETLDSLNPFVSGLENVSSPSGSIFGMNPPENIADCLRANQIIGRETLNAVGLPEILQNAPTPVARMLRSVFGQAHLANRLDTTVRCVETAIAMISLVFVAEYELEKRQNAGLEKALARFFPLKPTFGDWTTLFGSFVKNSESAFVRLIGQKLKEDAPPVGQELRAMIEKIGGAKAVNNVAAEIKTIRDTLPLLIAVRNAITAHGPSVERAAPELYRAVLLVTLDFLNSLEWQSFVFSAALPDKSEIYFKSCLPETVKNGSHNSETNKVFVKLSNGENNAQIEVSRFFQIEETTLSLAVYAEENRFVEPVSGLYVNFGQAGED